MITFSCELKTIALELVVERLLFCLFLVVFPFLTLFPYFIRRIFSTHKEFYLINFLEEVCVSAVTLTFCSAPLILLVVDKESSKKTLYIVTISFFFTI